MRGRGEKFDLYEIASALVCGRVCEPCSKRSTMEWASSSIDVPSFELHQVYRALSVLAESSDAVNSRRWEIGRLFRIMKHELDARPVYVSRRDRIEGYFLVCFIALLAFRLLGKELEDRFTCEELLKALRSMKLLELDGIGWLPAYERTEATDALNDFLSSRTDTEIIRPRAMRTILSNAKGSKAKKITKSRN